MPWDARKECEWKELIRLCIERELTTANIYFKKKYTWQWQDYERVVDEAVMHYEERVDALTVSLQASSLKRPGIPPLQVSHILK